MVLAQQATLAFHSHYLSAATSPTIQLDCEGDGCDDTAIQRLECANSLAANTGRRASASVQQQGRVSIAGCAASECGSWTCTPFAAEQLPIQAALGSVTITCEELQPHSAGSVDSGRREAEPGGEGRPWQAATDAADARASAGPESSSRAQSLRAKT